MAHTPRFALRSFIARIARVNLRFAVVTVLVGAAIVSSSTRAQRAAAPENFDVRSEKSAAVAAYLSRFPAPASFGEVAGARATGLARLQTDFPGIDIVGSPELGTPELVGVQPGAGFLTVPTTDRVAAMRGFLSAYADVYGLSQDQVASLELVADYANPAGNMAWVEFEQRINGLPVFQALIRGGFTARGELARTTGPLAAGLDARVAHDRALADGGTGGVAGRGERRAGGAEQRARAEGAATAARRAVFDRGTMADDAEGVAAVLPAVARRGAPRVGDGDLGRSRCVPDPHWTPKTARCSSARTSRTTRRRRPPTASTTTTVRRRSSPTTAAARLEHAGPDDSARRCSRSSATKARRRSTTSAG